MTDIAFHSGVAEPLHYACRLLRKAYRSGARVAVFGPPDTIDRLDQALWTFEPLEFIPHLVLPRQAGDADRLARTPIVLVREGGLEGAGAFGVGVSIDHAETLPTGCLPRVIEIVGTGDAQRQAARQRWRAYLQAGESPTNIDRAGNADA